jgi:hypothetical protein
MSHSWNTSKNSLTVEYKWKKNRWNSLKLITDNQPSEILSGSEEEFITEHYWGYTKVSEQKTSEYGVEHPRWHVYPTKEYSIDVDFQDVYGEDFAFLSTEKPLSAFLAEGSEIKVKSGKTLTIQTEEMVIL